MSTPSTPDALSLTDLPVPVGRYLTAHRERDADAALAVLTPDATIVDDGRARAGHEAIRTWFGSEAGEYSYTIEPTGAWRTGDEITVMQRLIGLPRRNGRSAVHLHPGRRSHRPPGHRALTGPPVTPSTGQPIAVRQAAGSGSSAGPTRYVSSTGPARVRALRTTQEPRRP